MDLKKPEEASKPSPGENEDIFHPDDGGNRRLSSVNARDLANSENKKGIEENF